MSDERWNGVKGAANILLWRLPDAERRLVAPHLVDHVLEPDAVVCRAGGSIRHAIFPLSGLISLVAPTAEGSVVHTGMVGREGLFGLRLSSGVLRSTIDARVQAGGDAVMIESKRFRQLLPRCPVLSARIQRFGLRTIDNVTRIAACNCHHPVEARMSSWILSISDRMRSSAISLKQAALADMLGILRPSISHAAGSMRARRIVDYHRGEMQILDKSGLKALACSCYAVAARSYRESLA